MPAVPATSRADELLLQLLGRFGTAPSWPDWVVGQVTREPVAVIRDAAALLADQPGRYLSNAVGDTDPAALTEIRRRLTDFVTRRDAWRPGLPPDESATRLAALLEGLGAYSGDSQFEEELTAQLLAEPAGTRAALAQLFLAWQDTPNVHRLVQATTRTLLGHLLTADRPSTSDRAATQISTSDPTADQPSVPDKAAGGSSVSDETAGLIDRRAVLDWSGRQELPLLPGLDGVLLAEYAAGRPHPLALAALRREAMHLTRADGPAGPDCPADAIPPATALAGRAGEPLWPLVNVGEVWADQLVADVESLPESERAAWRAALAHAGTARQTRPPAKWLKTGRTLVNGIGGAEFARRATGWLELVGRGRAEWIRPMHFGRGNLNELIDPYNVTVLRGLVWLVAGCATGSGAAVARVLGGLVEVALRAAEEVGPRCPRLANTAVQGLSMMEDPAAVGQLARLAARVRFKGTLKEVDKALAARAAALGVSREEIDELAVPSYGLTGVGRRTVTFGAARAEVTVGRSTVVGWFNSAGRAVKSVPAEVRRGHRAELGELTASVKDLDRMLAAQRDRLDRLALARRSWRWDAFRARYLDHPLVGTLARRLIWTVDGTACGWGDGAVRTVHGKPFEPDGGARVELWHPLGRDAEEVAGWRDFLRRYGITQPFKQAHREVYELTGAERETRTYSNRFAAHFLRQHQFHALAAARGWHDRLRLMVDDSYPPAYRELLAWGLRAEYRVAGAGTEWHEDTTDSGAYLRLATDQVRFYPAGAPVRMRHTSGGGGYGLPRGAGPDEPVPLDEVPPLVLSEVLRDVDLFVGVSSLGNDPTWYDGGPGGRFLGYWESYGAGELTATARTRRELLAELLPGLSIADRCELGDRFLRVRGELATYRIHLGSGTIMMEPLERYLCIVPAGRPVDDLYLPFEGDGMLTLILSKAFLLAADTDITDPSIRRQLPR